MPSEAAIYAALHPVKGTVLYFVAKGDGGHVFSSTLKEHDAAELWFLLGYVYYQMDRLEWAKKAIDAAYERMPESEAVAILKEAIDKAEE